MPVPRYDLGSGGAVDEAPTLTAPLVTPPFRAGIGSFDVTVSVAGLDGCMSMLPPEVRALSNRHAGGDDVSLHRSVRMDLELLGRCNVAGDMAHDHDGLRTHVCFDLPIWPNRQQMLWEVDRAFDLSVDVEVLVTGQFSLKHHQRADDGDVLRRCLDPGRVAIWRSTSR